MKEFSCEEKLNFACERERAYPQPIPPRPGIYEPGTPEVSTCRDCYQRRRRVRGRMRHWGVRGLRRRRIKPYFRSFLN